MAYKQLDLMMDNGLATTVDDKIYRRFIYSTSDTIAVVSADDYFVPAYNSFNEGDILSVFSSESGTKISKQSYLRVDSMTSTTAGVKGVKVVALT